MKEIGSSRTGRTCSAGHWARALQPVGTTPWDALVPIETLPGRVELPRTHCQCATMRPYHVEARKTSLSSICNFEHLDE